jgi:hypothetical protein
VASVAPGTDDGEAVGITVGDLWVDTTNFRTYVCQDATPGAAVWERTDQPKINIAASSDPTANDDLDLGYESGSLWINLNDAGVFVCISAADGAADWDEIAKV